MFHRMILLGKGDGLLAKELYEGIAALPIVSPHTHVPIELLANPDATFGSPADFFVIPDHYVLRMLYSRGVPMEALGVPHKGQKSTVDHRAIWRTFAEQFFLFRATPSGLWIRRQLATLFDITEPLDASSAERTYDQIQAKLSATTPREMFDSFDIETLCTTDHATDSLRPHEQLAASSWSGQVRPTFRPDDVTAVDRPGWRDSLDTLASLTDTEIGDVESFVDAIKKRRSQFIDAGAVASDHGATTPDTAELTAGEAESVFARALRGELGIGDAEAFSAHMLTQMAAMSCEDGLVMQLHAGARRDHNAWHHSTYGEALGGDIPIRVDFTNALHPLLNRYGNSRELTLVVFTLDESCYARELAPLAGHYPAMRLGAPWWFHDSPNGIERYLAAVVETAGIQNLAGFNDDARALGSIPVRHEIWRRCCARWLADLVGSGLLEDWEAAAVATELAVGLARSTYGGTTG